ncbi:MAG: Asp-tRNA(Asn)/Glu-tRNA(Gln) amidotransferase subunit GatA [Patescibacteria group bacterium]
MIDISKLTIISAREALRKGEFTSRELTQMCLDAIKEKDREIHAFLEVFDDALDQADKAQINLPLGGIPIAIKDNILFKNHKVSAGSKILENYTATYDSTVVKKLQEAGAIIIGRTNCDEFAMGSSTENSAFGPTKNPIDTTRVPGGSSGGSAAAVASGMVLVALGSDTGGSIRQPAAFTGIVGMKPTYGRVSRSGLIAMASSLDQIGPLAKTAEDAELLYDVIKGKDPMDSTTIGEDTYKVRKNTKTIGVPRDFFSDSLDKKVLENFENSLEQFKKLGYKIKDIKLPHLKYSLAVYYILVPAEVSSNLARFDGVKYGFHAEGGENSIDDYFKTRGLGFGREVRRRIILGTYVLSSGYYDAYYGQAQSMKSAITKELRDAFNPSADGVDFILTPTTPTPAFKFGEKSDPLSMYLADIFTVPANISGCPSISIPSGFVGKLPLGILLTADMGNESVLFEASKDFETIAN